MPPLVAGLLAGVAASTTLTACGAGPSGSTTLVVSAASSVAEAFERIAEEFESANPGIEVVLNVDGSATLATQIVEGAPADVFAAADEVSMQRVADAGLLRGPSDIFATNVLVVVTKPVNPLGVESLGDLSDLADSATGAGVRGGVVALCGAEVPCGRYAQRVLDTAGVRLEESGVTRGRNARAVLAAVADGDAVAGIVYATDARRAGDSVDTVVIPPAVNVVATYPIAVLSGSGAEQAASAFVSWVLGAAGQEVLAQSGFGPPP